MFKYELSWQTMNFVVNKHKVSHESVNRSMYVEESQEWELPVQRYNDGCQDGGMDRHSNQSSHKSGHSHCHAVTHPFHMHGSHFQITLVDNTLDPDGLLYAVGEWRDTIPLSRSNTQIRFTPRDNVVGRILTHCHFASHSDQGMAQLVRVHDGVRRRPD